MKYMRWAIVGMALTMLAALGVASNANAMTTAPHHEPVAYTTTTTVTVKDLTPGGRVLTRHVYRASTLSGALSSATNAKSTDDGGYPTNTGRRWIKVQSANQGMLGEMLWHQWVKIDWTWHYPAGVTVNSSSRGWHKDDATVEWKGWISGSTGRFAWAGALYPNSGYYRKTQGSWENYCLSPAIKCHYYPNERLWVHSDGTWHAYWDNG